MNRNTDHDLPANNNLFSKKKKKKTIRNRRSRIFLFIKRLSVEIVREKERI